MAHFIMGCAFATAIILLATLLGHWMDDKFGPPPIGPLDDVDEQEWD